MSTLPAALRQALASRERHWLVTGSAGFIGSHLVEALLRHGQRVTGFDNLSTGSLDRLAQVRALVGEAAWSRHRFVQADIADADACAVACAGVDIVLHQAALGSVPRSLRDPAATHRANATGFLELLDAARRAGVPRFVFASSSAVYGDSPTLPKVEDGIGRPLSPYAVTKLVDELYADVFARQFGIQTIGLRYFNVFGARQDPHGPYAAVIPKWIDAMLRGERCTIHGDGETSRDFCYVGNVVQANLLGGLTTTADATRQVYNVAAGGRTTLTQLHAALAAGLQAIDPALHVEPPAHDDFRDGDIRHSLADVTKAARLLGYQPTHDLHRGLAEALPWYVARHPDRGA